MPSSCHLLFPYNKQNGSNKRARDKVSKPPISPRLVPTETKDWELRFQDWRLFYRKWEFARAVAG